MTEIEKKALALLNEVAADRDEIPYYEISRDEFNIQEALCRAIEQHEAFRQEVSDVVEAYLNPNNRIYSRTLYKFIIPKPTVDPLAEAWIEATGNTVGMGPLNEALAKRGLKIVEDV